MHSANCFLTVRQARSESILIAIKPSLLPFCAKTGVETVTVGLSRPECTPFSWLMVISDK